MAPLLMFAAMFGMLFVVSALRNTAWGVLAVFGFTFVAGVMLAPILQYAAGMRNGGQLVALAGGMTAAVFFVMATIATVSKRDFSFLGKFLFVGLVLLIIASIANLFFQVPAVAVTLRTPRSIRRARYAGTCSRYPRPAMRSLVHAPAPRHRGRALPDCMRHIRCVRVASPAAP